MIDVSFGYQPRTHIDPTGYQINQPGGGSGGNSKSNPGKSKTLGEPQQHVG